MYVSEVNDRFALPVRQCHAFKQACETGVNAQPSGAQRTETVGLAVRFINAVKVITISVIKSRASPPDRVAVRRGHHEVPAVDHLRPPDWSGSRSGVHTGQVVIRIRIGLWIRSDLVGLWGFWVLCLGHRCWSVALLKWSPLRKPPSEEARFTRCSTALVCRAEGQRSSVIKWSQRTH